MPARISLCLIVKDEAANLPRCLASVQGVVDEIVVVDTGSTDATPEIARAAGARGLAHSWNGDFAAARNVSLAAATGDWILVLDADEELTTEGRRQLRAVVADTTADGLFVTVLNQASPEDVVAEYPAASLRLFRNRPAYRYRGRLHEQISETIQSQGGRLAAVPVTIRHWGYQAAHVQGQADRRRRNTALLEQALAEAPGDLYLTAKLGCAYFYAGRPAEAGPPLQMFFADPGALNLNPEVRQEAHLVSALLANAAGDFAPAREHAQAALTVGGNPALQLKARLTLATIALRQGQLAAQTAAGAPAARQFVAEAEAHLETLAAQPQLNTRARAETAEWLAASRAFAVQLAAAAEARHAAMLQALLEAEDLPAALDTLAPRFETGLPDFVQRQADAARQAGELELAQGLEALAAHCAALLKARAGA